MYYLFIFLSFVFSCITFSFAYLKAIWQLISGTKLKSVLEILRQRRTCFIHLPVFRQSFLSQRFSRKQRGSQTCCGCLEAFRKWLQLGVLQKVLHLQTHTNHWSFPSILRLCEKKKVERCSERMYLTQEGSRLGALTLKFT